jgi:hypothetical protein
MKLSRTPAFAIGVLALVLAAEDASAVRYAERPLLWQRTAVSGYGGYGFPVGVFASNDVPGDGNHAEGAVDYAFEIEHFAGRTWSIGFSAAYAEYEDKTDPSLKTNLETYSGFFRIVVPSGTSIRPYFRAGMGGQQVEFSQSGAFRVDADYSFSMQFGAGLLWLPVRWLGLNAQALYYRGFTEDAYIAEENAIVGFDTSYFTFAAGVSLFFP